MTADGTEGHPSRADSIVAEFGGGLDVNEIANRHRLSVAQVYAVIEQEVGPPPTGQGSPDDDAIVAEYGEGNDVEMIARRRDMTVEQVYTVLRRTLQDGPPPPPPSW